MRHLTLKEFIVSLIELRGIRQNYMKSQLIIQFHMGSVPVIMRIRICFCPSPYQLPKADGSHLAASVPFFIEWLVQGSGKGVLECTQLHAPQCAATTTFRWLRASSLTSVSLFLCIFNGSPKNISREVSWWLTTIKQDKSQMVFWQRWHFGVWIRKELYKDNKPPYT